ncbi:MAG TPA: pteridine reductase [Gammaproteobacteria bacterium]|jgi:pteridine reductase|nr:pteridine reductase [Gammaproteobacteria bacterium]
MQKISSQVALITGAARRIGAEIAQHLHRAGMHIAMHYNTSGDEALTLCEQFNNLRPGSAICLQADLQAVGMECHLIEQIKERWGRLDALVNNASRFYKTQVGEVSISEWEDLMNANLRAPFFLSQAAAPLLAENQGSIVNITDLHGERPLSGYPVYSITKGGLLMLTKVLAKELGPRIRVNAVSPGAIIWPEGQNSLSESEKQKLVDHLALKKDGEPADIARAVLFFIKEAPYVTGQVLTVDGGRLLGDN